ncbi:MAG: filamentous hemagglutinin N-terminal domain-containing protein [Leptolyngbyaceae cyanobacterium MAG.088]|nr:filamentous hemagglutinin N-terminal domain-containing protein [Leptolyngbyaceae cyanobacterium MAG.088]
MLPVALLAAYISPTPLPSDTVEVPPSPVVQSPLPSPTLSNGKPILLAQAITASDAGTVITSTDNQIDITGGQMSEDGANVFHNFLEFSLDEDQIANFVATPDVENILGNVSGGNASFINGVLQVSDSNANLYLTNPAGIIFGADAALNLNGDFTATTADRIGFGENWLNIMSAEEYSSFLDTPDQFDFSADEPGGIINLGTLEVDAGQGLTLLGGDVINSGTLLAPDGEITLLAVTGNSRVRINPDNHLLGLEVSSLALTEDTPTITPLSLPELLTGGVISDDLVLTTAPDGTVNIQTTSTTVPVFSGSTIVAGQVSTTGEQGGQIALLGERVSLIGTGVDASGDLGGGTVLVGGDFQGQGNVPNAVQTIVDSETQITANSLNEGDGGRIIVWADDHTHFSGQASVQAANGDGGFVEISGKESLEFSGQVDASAPNGETGTLLLDPTNIQVVAIGEDTNNLDAVDEFSDPDLGLGSTTRIDVDALNNANANIELQATNDITFTTDVNAPVSLTARANNNIELGGDITVDGDITLQADADNDGVGDINTRGGERQTQASNNIDIEGNVNTGGDSLTIQADTDNDGVGVVMVDNQVATEGGNVTISGASLQLGSISTTSLTTANSGAVDLNSTGDIVFESIDTSANDPSGTAGTDAGNVEVIANGTVRGTEEDTPSVACRVNAVISPTVSVGGTNWRLSVGST